MLLKHRNEIRRINYFTTEMESLYHLTSLKFGISDSVSIVLYTIYDEGNSCLLRDIYKKSGINKQTINSAIRTLERDGIVFLEQYNGKSKMVNLTDKGREFVKNTAERLRLAETKAFDGWAENEISDYIRLMEKYTECFRRQVELL